MVSCGCGMNKFQILNPTPLNQSSCTSLYTSLDVDVDVTQSIISLKNN